MKLLLDQGLPRTTLKHLAALGIQAEHVGEIGMASATDNAILDFARQTAAVLVTLDADFHYLLAASRATSPSVIRIQIERLNGEQLAKILTLVISVARTDLDSGAVVSTTKGRIRVRRLPIGR
jgi:predicted nuclease of predicted toxin-antitoxin system